MVSPELWSYFSVSNANNLVFFLSDKRNLQGKRKSSKPPPKKVAPKIDTMFTCPFCNHDKAVIAKMDHLTEKGLVLCTICGQKFTSEITHLSEPIDVYSEWIDACEEANM